MDLIKYLPSFYYNSNEVVNIQSSIGAEEKEIKAAINDLLDQLFINTATWGLDYWEEYLGLKIDKAERLDSRRSRIMTRLRGQGTTTKEMIINVCSSFSGTKVEVIEDFSNYSFKIKFVGMIGIPSNVEYLASTIEEIKPAHLGFSFEYVFNTHYDIGKFKHRELKLLTHKAMREEKLN